jgi:hypothetical protein
VHAAGGVARREHPAKRGLLARYARLERFLPDRQARQLRLCRAALGLQVAQRAVGVRDGALRVAQRIARLAPIGFLRVEPGLQRLDARAQRAQVRLAACLRSGTRGEGEGDEQRADQVLALPCADTTATRRATSSASPR